MLNVAKEKSVGSSKNEILGVFANIPEVPFYDYAGEFLVEHRGLMENITNSGPNLNKALHQLLVGGKLIQVEITADEAFEHKLSGTVFYTTDVLARIHNKYKENLRMLVESGEEEAYIIAGQPHDISAEELQDVIDAKEYSLLGSVYLDVDPVFEVAVYTANDVEAAELKKIGDVFGGAYDLATYAGHYVFNATEYADAFGVTTDEALNILFSLRQYVHVIDPAIKTSLSMTVLEHNLFSPQAMEPDEVRFGFVLKSLIYAHNLLIKNQDLVRGYGRGHIDNKLVEEAGVPVNVIKAFVEASANERCQLIVG
jgi:hypothetical protein